MSRSRQWFGALRRHFLSHASTSSGSAKRQLRRSSFERLESRLPLAVTLSPVADASIHDEPRDGIGDTFNTSMPGLLREQWHREDRAIAEYDLGSITDSINLAVLDFALSSLNAAGGQLRTFDVLVYGGNGQADLSDFSIPGSLVHTITFSVPQGSDTYRLDLTGHVQSLVAGGSSFVGVRWDPVGDQYPVMVHHAELTINGVAPAQGKRGWEAFPNAIRTDGAETFRLEVDAGGAVKAVTLDTATTSSWLVAPSPGVIAMRDDGLEGDRVAGDFIFTSGQFRYDTSKPLLDFFENDPDSPPGVSIVGVGAVSIEELDGSVAEPFLIQPDVGLLRADIPNVATQSLSNDVVVSPHLINVNTDAIAVQHSMRGGSFRVNQVTKPIYEVLPDEFDFFTFFSTNHAELLPRLSAGNFRAGVHHSVQVDFTGSALPSYDGTANFGSAGRLLGLNLLDTMDRGMHGNNATHELVHQWSAYYADSLGLTSTYGHFARNTSAGSLVGGQAWIDNGDGTYTIDFTEGRNGATRAAAIDLYMMGLIEASEVPNILLHDPALDKFDDPVVQPDEIVRSVAVADIVAVHGARTPGVAASRKDFRIGFVAESDNRFLTPTEMTFYEIFAAHYARKTPAGEADPYVGSGWSSIDRFFGHGTTWSTLVPGQTETANNPPTATPATFAVSAHATDGSSVGTVAATDADSGQTLLYSIIGGNTGNTFRINSATGEIAVAKSSQLSGGSQYLLSVRVSDSGIPSQYDTVSITIDVEQGNIAPVVNDQSFSVAENSGAGTAVGTVVASDADTGQLLTYAITAGNSAGAFSIDSSTGVITVADGSQLNYESSSSFSLTVKVTDNGTPALSDTATVTVMLQDVNEPPAVDAQAFQIAEHSPQGTAVGKVVATDPDAGQSLTYAITAGDSAGVFAISPSTGAITVADSSQLNYEASPSFSLTVKVIDNGTPALSDTATVTVTLQDVNEPPAVDAQAFQIAEHSPQGTAVGKVVATDPDAGQSLTYAIAAGNVDGAFAVDATTGQVTVNNANAIDYETTPTFALTISVTDNGNPALTTSATVTISLTDVFELLADLKPGDDTNTLNSNADAKFEIAILSTATFDATARVDVDTLRFGKTGTEDSLSRHRKTGQPKFEFRDVNGDGLLDLVATFELKLTSLQSGDTLGTLSGSLSDGTTFDHQFQVTVTSGGGGKTGGKGGPKK